jgi:hypothetical protein
MRVKSSGEPDRDDTGLPRVDVEIPDDARELDRDVQAYYRELKAERRQQRRMRMHGALARDGMVIPLLVCCLIFALVTGTLLTLFTATSIDNSLPTPVNAGHTTAAGTPRAGRTSATRPAPASRLVTPAAADSTIPVGVAGSRRQLGALRPAVLLVQQSGCACGPAVARLARLARAAHVPAYLVALPAHLATARSEAARAGFGLQAASDINGSLSEGFGSAGLTAVIVDAGGAVSYAQTLQASANLPAVLSAAGV